MKIIGWDDMGKEISQIYQIYIYIYLYLSIYLSILIH